MGCCINLVAKKGEDRGIKSEAQSLFDHKFKTNLGEEVDFNTFKGNKAILVVNVANEWGSL